MFLITGEITDTTRHELEPGCVFRVVYLPYSTATRPTRLLCMVDATFMMGEVKFLELSTLDLDNTYQHKITTDCWSTSDDKLNQIQHVEYEEAVLAFTKQFAQAQQTCNDTQTAYLAARARLASFTAVADRLDGEAL